MKELVQEASVPQYANEEVQKYDEYVKNGGSLRDFYTSFVENKIDPESINIENEYDQKRAIRENYINQGYSEDRVSRMIKRYEEAGVLEDEASDALELLKEYNEKTEKALLDEQKNRAETAKLEQQKFIDTVQESVKTLDNVRGVKISQKDKDELLEYILVPDKSGMTQYQREYLKDVKNLLESAYFTKKGDVLINNVKKKGESDAVKNLHEKLKANKGNKASKGGNAGDGSGSSGLGLLGSMLQGS